MIDPTVSAVCSWCFRNTYLHNESLNQLHWPTIVPHVLVLPQRFCIEHYSTWLKLTPLLLFHLLSLLDRIAPSLINPSWVSMISSFNLSHRYLIVREVCVG